MWLPRHGVIAGPQSCHAEKDCLLWSVKIFAYGSDVQAGTCLKSMMKDMPVVH
jgi:hypothetical protein